MTIHYLTLTLACHTHGGFVAVGGAGFLTEREMQESFESADENYSSEFELDGSRFNFILDKNGAERHDRLDEKPITKETAERLTGERWHDLCHKGLMDLKKIQPCSFSDGLKPIKSEEH